MKLRDAVCRNCKYSTIYYCKRHAPIIKGDDYVGRWPGITDWQDWCGDWEAKATLFHCPSCDKDIENIHNAGREQKCPHCGHLDDLKFFFANK